ncbi:ABC transporter substrate-binding protein [bacterium]|nr:ABC transporter substrate-binding protein [bacterium]
MKKVSPLILIILSSIVLVSSGYCQGVPTTLVYGRGSDSIGLDAAQEEDGESFLVCENIYDALVQYKQDSADIEPALAESWDTSEDGLVWTFHLRRGVKFHDGTSFNANAVLFSYNRQRDKNHPFHNVGKTWVYWNDLEMNDIIEDIKAVNEFTVRMTLKRAYAPFINVMAIPPFNIVSPTTVKKWGEEFTSHPVGTGPFKFVNWARNDRIVLEANPNYWGGKSGVQRLIFRTIPESSVRLLELQRGNIHIMEFPNPDELEIIRDDKNLALLEVAGINVGYIAMNFNHKPFDNKKVRLAVNHAINKQSIVDNLYMGLGIVAKNPIPPTVWGYDDSIEDFTYDPKLAKQLLKEAGYPDGFSTTLWQMPNPRPYFPDPRSIAVQIQSDLKNVGIDAKIETREWGKYLEEVKKGTHDMAMLGWIADFIDPDNFLYTLFEPNSTLNIAFYRNEKLREILVTAQKATDQEKRIQLYQEAQRIIHADVPWVCIAHAKQVAVVSKKVKGYILNPITWKHLWRARIEK